MARKPRKPAVDMHARVDEATGGKAQMVFHTLAESGYVVIPAEDYERLMSRMRLQRRSFEECETAQWDPEKSKTFGDEIAHLHEEVSEAFRAWRKNRDFEITFDEDGKPQGVPIEFADVAIGMLYNAQLHGFDLFSAIDIKHAYNLTRDYGAEGRRL